MFLGYFAERLLLGLFFLLFQALVFIVAFPFLTVGIPVFPAFFLSQVLQRFVGGPFGGFGAAGGNEQDRSQTDYPGDMFVFHDECVFRLVHCPCSRPGILFAGNNCVNK